MRLPLLLIATAALATPVRADDDAGHRASSPATGYPAAPEQCGILMRGEGLRPGERQTSCDGRFILTLQSDGDLVLSRADAGVLWSSRSAGCHARYLVMRPEGMLAVVDDVDRTVWQSHPFGIAGSYARLQDDGDLGVFDPGGRPLWHTGTVQWPVDPPASCGTLRGGEGLVLGQQLTSCDGQVRLALSLDGDLTLQVGERIAFHTDTAGRDGRYLRFEEDAELVLYDARGALVWTSAVRGFVDARAVLAEGMLAIVASSGEILWSSAFVRP